MFSLKKFNLNMDLKPWIDKIVRQQKPYQLALMTQVLNRVVPFNGPHKFKVTRFDSEHVHVSIPFKRINQNHVRGIHACAIATLGEICAGLSIVRQYGLGRYRFVLAKLTVDYHYQGKTALTGMAHVPHGVFEEVEKELASAEKTTLSVRTMIEDEQSHLVAEVNTVWQLKEWGKVRTKVG